MRRLMMMSQREASSFPCWDIHEEDDEDDVVDYQAASLVGNYYPTQMGL